MTSEEITGKQKTCSDPKSTPLWEIAYQLAVLNERNEAGDSEAVNRMLRKVGLADPQPGKRDADSERGAVPTPIGWRCLSCKYGRDFADMNLKPKGQELLESGYCPACGENGLGIAFKSSHPQPSPRAQPADPAPATGSQSEKDNLADPQPGRGDADSERGTDTDLWVGDEVRTIAGAGVITERKQPETRYAVKLSDNRTLYFTSSELERIPPRPQPADPAPATGSEHIIPASWDRCCANCGFHRAGHKVAGNEAASNKAPQFRGDVFPKIAPDGSGRWGVWFGPGPPLQSFESEEMAREYLKKIADRMSESEPPIPPIKGSEPTPGIQLGHDQWTCGKCGCKNRLVKKTPQVCLSCGAPML